MKELFNTFVPSNPSSSNGSFCAEHGWVEPLNHETMRVTHAPGNAIAAVHNQL